MNYPRQREYRYIFGPVLSRRLGVSLGVDLMPHKTCSLDCIYCECGKTTHLTLERKAYVPLDRVKAELESILSTDPDIDFITFSGAGEPTLHSGIEEITRFVKRRFPRYRLALLTNGTLFDRPELRAEVAEIDLVVASLDAATEAVFRRMNRPHPGLSLAAMKAGLVSLGKELPGRLWIEVFVAPGVNDSDDELGKIREVIEAIRPEKVQLNTLDRPGTENWVKPLDPAGMARVVACIHSVELIPFAGSPRYAPVAGEIPERLMSAIRRRPCTVTDLGHMMGIPEIDVCRHLELLIQAGNVVKKEMPRGVFYLSVELPGERVSGIQ